MDTKLLDANQENDEHRFEGYWSVPSCHSDVPGVLVFKTEESCVLHLFRAFDEMPGFKSYPIIHGMINDGSFVTIFDALSSGVYGVPGRWQMRCEASDVWCSQEGFFNSKKDVRFKEFSFGINRLRNWDERNGFSPIEFRKQENGEDIAAIEYKTPPNILLYEDSYVKIDLIYYYAGSGLSIVQKEAYIRDYPRIVISSKKNLLKYYGETRSIDYYYRLITTFMMILIGDNTFAFDMRGNNLHIHHCGDGRDIHYGLTTMHYQRRPLCNSPVNDGFKSADFSLNSIIKYLPRICKKYKTVFNKVSMQIYKIQRFVLLKSGLDLEAMLYLVFACDGIAENLFTREGHMVLDQHKRVALPKDDVSLKERAFDLCENDTEVSQWLTRVTGLVRGPSLAMWLRGALDSIKGTTKSLNDDATRAKIIDYIKEVRQAGAHSLSDEAKHIQSDPELLVYMTIYMFYILRIMLLCKCGYPGTEVKQSLLRERVQFGFYDSEISKRLATWTKFKKRK